MTIRSVIAGALAWSVIVMTAATAHAQPKPANCEAAVYRQFDFWLGQWELFEHGAAAKAADVRIEAILDGCALREDYSDADGVHGTSLSSYDVRTSRWQQTWMTNRGQQVVIQGSLQGKELVFSGWRHDGPTELLVRARWIPDGVNVRQTAETSADNGRTWKPWFDLDFRPKPPSPRPGPNR